MRAALLALATAAVLTGTVAAHDPEAPERHSTEPRIAEPRTVEFLIRQAYEAGRIDRAEMILTKAYSLYAPEFLPDEYRDGAPAKCGTPIAREIDDALPHLPDAIATEIRDMRARPVCDTYYDTARFRIHYDTSGPHMILGWPGTTYRDAIAAVAEECWDFEVDTLAFRQPPGDGGDPDGGGGNALYDIYLRNCTGYLGYCQGSYTQPGLPLNDCSSYIVIDNDFAGFGFPDPVDGMKVTVAHEFCHACQFAHSYDQPVWYMECTSMWAEDTVYDDINDYTGYIFYYINYPYCSLDWNDGTGLRMYGSCIWNFFLTDRFDRMVPPDIWDQCEFSGSLFNKINAVLSGRGSTLEDAFTEFAVWTWFTGARHDGNHYEEGNSWPMVAAEKTYSSYPLVGGGPIPLHRPDHLAWNYVHLVNPGGPEDLLQITYDGPTKAVITNRVAVNTKTTGGVTAEYAEMTLDASGDGEIGVAGWDTLSRVCVVAVNASTTTDDMDYIVDVVPTTPVEAMFYATPTALDAVTLRWTLANPSGILSLDVERSRSENDGYVAINDAPLPPTPSGSYVDTDVAPGDECWYRLMATFWDGSQDTVGPAPVRVVIDGTPALALAAPSPNPVMDATEIAFTVPSEGARVTLRIYDASGRVVKTLHDGTAPRGRQSRTWTGTDDAGRRVAAGVYFATLEVAGERRTGKIVLIR